MKRSPFSANDGSGNGGSNGQGGNTGGSAEESMCRAYVRYLGAFLDGELDAGKQIEVEGHIESCETCRERMKLDGAMRGTLKKVVGEDAHEAASGMLGVSDGMSGMDAMRARMRAAMTAETARADQAVQSVRAGQTAQTGQAATPAKLSNGQFHAPSAPFGWRAMLPLTAAAALALVWGAASQRSAGRSPFAAAIPSAMTAQAGMGEDPLAELVAEHSRPLPPDTDSQGMRALEQYVGVPVHAVSLEKAGARLVGGRVMPVQQERAAMLQYVVGKGDDARRVSMFIYDPRKIHVGCNDCAPRTVGTSEVQVGRAGGYSVAVTQRGGVGYALASDLGPERSFELASLVDAD